MKWKVPGSNPVDPLPVLETQPLYEVSGHLQIGTWINAVKNIEWVTLAPHFTWKTLNILDNVIMGW